jgi:hypothetical protein
MTGVAVDLGQERIVNKSLNRQSAGSTIQAYKREWQKAFDLWDNQQQD